jgi:hypothetical protein
MGEVALVCSVEQLDLANEVAVEGFAAFRQLN